MKVKYERMHKLVKQLVYQKSVVAKLPNLLSVDMKSLLHAQESMHLIGCREKISACASCTSHLCYKFLERALFLLQEFPCLKECLRDKGPHLDHKLPV